MKNKFVFILILAMVLGIATFFVSCGGDDAEKNGTVHVYCFGDYIDPALVDEFENETGIKVVMDTFDTNEEMYPVIKNNSASYDVVCASDYMIEKMQGEKLLAEINFDQVPNLKNIEEKYLQIAESFDPGNKYSVPHTWGTMGIIYNPKAVKKGTITSWTDLWDKQYKGQIAMPDSLRDTMAIALKAKGYSLNTTDEKQIKEASAYLSAQKPLVYKYANDSARELILNESANLAVVWSGEVLYCREINPDLEFVIPKEGSEEFIDSWAIPETAKNKENGEKWINFMLDQDVALTNYEYLTYTIPNVSVKNLVKDDAKKKAILFPEEAILEKCEALKSLKPETEDLYSKYWKKFKS